jgi:hypothetical protein
MKVYVYEFHLASPSYFVLLCDIPHIFHLLIYAWHWEY